MKIFLPLYLAFLVTISSSGQTGRDVFFNEHTFFLDQNGTSINKAEFEKILESDPLTYHRWDQLENDSVRIARLIPAKEEKTISYPSVYNALEKITGTSIQGNPVIIIFYNYFDDLCSRESGLNEWNTLQIRRNKRFSDNLKRMVQKQYPNVIAYHFFEPGISIEPSQILKQYFYIDKDRYFMNTLFNTKSSCGSVALILPGGNTVIHNGQTSIPVLANLPAR